MKSKTHATFLPVLIILCGGLVLGLAAWAAPHGQSGGGKKAVKDIAVVDISADKDDCRLWVTYQNKGTLTIQATLRERTSVQGVGVVEDTFSAFNLPPGQYFGHGVGADPGYKIFGINKTVTTEIDVDNVLAEINESNNTLTKTLGCSLLHHPDLAEAPPKPDLVIPYIKFVVVQEGDDAAGHYVIFNAIVYVKNVGQGGCGPFDVLLEHQINGQGPYLTCATCKIHVTGLSAGQGKELEPRQYNKRGTTTTGQAIFFRATADCDNARVETDETNNVCKDSYQGQSGHK